MTFIAIFAYFHVKEERNHTCHQMELQLINKFNY